MKPLLDLRGWGDGTVVASVWLSRVFWSGLREVALWVAVGVWFVVVIILENKNCDLQADLFRPTMDATLEADVEAIPGRRMPLVEATSEALDRERDDPSPRTTSTTSSADSFRRALSCAWRNRWACSLTPHPPEG